MAKKGKTTSTDLVARLRAAQDQLRGHSARAARAADTIGQLIRQVEAQASSADPGADAPARRPRAAAGARARVAAPRGRITS